MPSYLYAELSQRMPKILAPRYEALRFENGDFIPTDTDLVPGAREIVYERFSEFGDADLLSDAGTNIPIVDISLDEDRYPIFMIGSGFPISFQEEQAIDSGIANRGINGRSNFNRFDQRMTSARTVIAQRTNRFTAFGKAEMGMPGFVNNPLITPVSVATPGGAASFGVATYQQMCDFFVEQVETITDNFVSEEPTTAVISAVANRRLAVQNANGTKSVRQFLAEEYPDLNFVKTREVSNSAMTNLGGMTPTANYDRMIFYPNKSNVVHRHIQNNVAELLPEDYIRVDGMRKIYTMYSCFSPAIVDYPQDVRYVDVKVA